MHRIQPLLPEQINILALLYRVCHIEDCGFLRLLAFVLPGIIPLGIFLSCAILLRLVLFRNIRRLSLLVLRLFIFLNAVFQSEVFIIQVLEQNVIHHTLRELVVFDTTEFDKGTDIIPVRLIVFPFCLTHTSELICHFLSNVF